jgi:hypothetical protein
LLVRRLITRMEKLTPGTGVWVDDTPLGVTQAGPSSPAVDLFISRCLRYD